MAWRPLVRGRVLALAADPTRPQPVMAGCLGTSHAIGDATRKASRMVRSCCPPHKTLAYSLP